MHLYFVHVGNYPNKAWTLFSGNVHNHKLGFFLSQKSIDIFLISTQKCMLLVPI